MTLVAVQDKVAVTVTVTMVAPSYVFPTNPYSDHIITESHGFEQYKPAYSTELS